MSEPTRPLLEPTLNEDGCWVGRGMLTPKAMTTRGELSIPPSRVIPVIIVPGIMGSNLRVNQAAARALRRGAEGDGPAWRPPNTALEKYHEWKKWEQRKAAQRQRILDPAILEVDDGGSFSLADAGEVPGFDDAMAHTRGWGEVYWNSYGKLIGSLQHNLNRTYQRLHADGGRRLQAHWRAVNEWDRKDWGRAPSDLNAPLTEAEFDRSMRFHYPVYVCGYSWLRSNAESAQRLQRRVEEIIHYYASRSQDCQQAILVTHSMGGFVARACARQIPGKILGVIHGVMPTLGAPVCYRRFACGTETSSPSAGLVEKGEMAAFAVIAGRNAAETTPVMATAPGILELLPNHLFPRPWLFVTTKREHAPDADLLRLPEGNPYDLYRDTTSWYRMIDPALVDPSDFYKDDAMARVIKAITQAEEFHTKILDNYYHPNTYAFYIDDPAHLSFGQIRWSSEGLPSGLSPHAVRSATFEGATFSGGRNVAFAGRGMGLFKLVAEQEAFGDGTVPGRSGAGPSGQVRHLFCVSGCNHQDSYNNDAMPALTQHLIAKMVQAVP